MTQRTEEDSLMDAWDKYYGNLPEPIRRKLSVDDIRNLGRGFYLAFGVLLRNKIVAEREACAAVAEAHKGSATKRRHEKFPFLKRSAEAEILAEIQAEERGEDIAAEIIARTIRERTGDAPTPVNCQHELGCTLCGAPIADIPRELCIGLHIGFVVLKQGECRYHDTYNRVWLIRPTAHPELPLEIVLESC